MSVFVNYNGPSLGQKQRRVVRSQAMVAVRNQQKQAKATVQGVTLLAANARLLLPAQDAYKRPCGVPRAATLNDSESEPERANPPTVTLQVASRPTPAPNSSQKRIHVLQTQHSPRPHPQPQPYDMRGPPPLSTHQTGVPSRTFHAYLSRCASYSSFLDEAFLLTPGFRQPSYFRPDLSKAACIYIGWLLTAGVLDAFSGGSEVVYPQYEYLAVRELKGFVEGAECMGVAEVVYPVVILGIFEMVRFSPRAITHLAAVEKIINFRGGLAKMPDVMQHLVIMTDLLSTISFSTPLAFNQDLTRTPTYHLTTPSHFPPADQLLSSPLLLCNSEDFALLAQYVDTVIAVPLTFLLESASSAFHAFFNGTKSSHIHWDKLHSSKFAINVDMDVDALAGIDFSTNVSGVFLQTCALATRIMLRILMTPAVSPGGRTFGDDDLLSQTDVQIMYENLRFMGLKPWAGLPYVYVWVNLIGFAAAKEKRIKMHFLAEVVRCAFSWGCYHMEIFRAVLGNFIHLQNAVLVRGSSRS